MEHSKIEKYLNQALNMALSINGESTYTNSFFVEVKEDGFLFVPRTPAGYLIDDDLYQKIFIQLILYHFKQRIFMFKELCSFLGLRVLVND
jgi:hypothetical protein